MGSGSTPDGVLDILGAGRDHLTFRLGLQWRDPLRSAPPPDSLLPARYVRIQVASPPPERVDGTPWHDGLVVSERRPVRSGHAPPADGRVDPLGGVAPLGQPDPETIVFDRWLAVPAVPPTQALTRTFEIDTADPSITPLSFLSVPYPDASIDGKRLAVVGVDYYYEGTIEFDRPAKNEWIAVSLERFFPPERASAELIVRVQSAQPELPVQGATATAAPREPVDIAPTSPVTADVAGRRCPAYFCQPIISGVGVKKRPAP